MTHEEREQQAELRKPPIVLDPNADAILRTLDEQMANVSQML